MANAKLTINDLPNELTSLADDDLLAVWDTSGISTAKITSANVTASLVAPAVTVEATNRINADAGLQAQIDLKAPLANPALTGVPTAPTAAPGTNDSTIANTAFVKAAVDAAAGAVVSVNGEVGAVVLDAADVGLGSFAGYTPATLPLSTADVGALATKEPNITVGTTAQYWRGDKTFQPTLDLPVSTATQTALNLKARLLESGRSDVGLGGMLSVADIDTTLTNAAWTDALEALIQRCCTETKTLFVPPGITKLITRLMSVSGICSIMGLGSNSILKTTGLNTSILKFNVSAYTSGIFWYKFHIYNDIASTSNTLSAGIEITSPVYGGTPSGAPYLEQNLFEEVTFTGCYAGIKNTMSYLTSSFGRENLLNNTTFRHIAAYYRPGFVNAKYGVWMTYGSGTGNVIQDPRGNIAVVGAAGSPDIAVNSSHFRVDGGAGVVCQDLIGSGHITQNSASLFSVDGTMSLNNIRVTDDTQIDAGALDGICFDPAATSIYNIADFAAYGGELDAVRTWPRGVGITSRGQGLSDQRKGVSRSSLASGSPATMHVCRAEIAQFTGCTLFVQVGGIVQGVQGGCHFAIIEISRDSTVPVLKTILSSTNTPTTTNANFFQIKYEILAGGIVDIYAVYTAASSGSACDGQTWLLGGTALLRRGLSTTTPTGALTAIDRNADQWTPVYSWTPTISFASGSGVTYGAGTAGTYTVRGRTIKLWFYIEVTGLGTGSGAAALSGLPFVIANTASQYGAGVYLDAIQNFTGLTGSAIGRPAIGAGTQFDLKTNNGGTAIAATNFNTGAGTVVLAGSVEYLTN